jgi:vancomycin permeability regulator SanA
MSGDNRNMNHNEVQAMKNFALDQGLPEDDIILDHAGRSTYDSCYRLKEIFNLQKIILVTQEYHLRRALYICNKMGIDALGVAAENRGYAKQAKYTGREIGASIQAWFDVNIFKPKPILGNKQEVIQ